MTPIAWALLGIVWGLLSSILTHKWQKADFWVDQAAVIICCWLFLPITLIVAIIRQTFLEDWK